MSSAKGNSTFTGLGAAPGRASGKAHVVRKVEDIMNIPAGSILILRILHPHLAPLLPRLGGLIVEEGAILQHATTLARECGIPAVVGIANARDLFQDGDILELDGARGVIIRRTGH